VKGWTVHRPDVALKMKFTSTERIFIKEGTVYRCKYFKILFLRPFPVRNIT